MAHSRKIVRVGERKLKIGKLLAAVLMQPMLESPNNYCMRGEKLVMVGTEGVCNEQERGRASGRDGTSFGRGASRASAASPQAWAQSAFLDDWGAGNINFRLAC